MRKVPTFTNHPLFIDAKSQYVFFSLKFDWQEKAIEVSSKETGFEFDVTVSLCFRPAGRIATSGVELLEFDISVLRLGGATSIALDACRLTRPKDKAKFRSNG